MIFFVLVFPLCVFSNCLDKSSVTAFYSNYRDDIQLVAVFDDVVHNTTIMTCDSDNIVVGVVSDFIVSIAQVYSSPYIFALSSSGTLYGVDPFLPNKIFISGIKDTISMQGGTKSLYLLSSNGLIKKIII